MKKYIAIIILIYISNLYGQVPPPPVELEPSELNKLREKQESFDRYPILKIDNTISGIDNQTSYTNIRKEYPFQLEQLGTGYYYEFSKRTIYSLDSLGFKSILRNYYNIPIPVHANGLESDNYPRGSYTFDVRTADMSFSEMNTNLKDLYNSGGKVFAIKQYDISDYYKVYRFKPASSYKNIKKSITPKYDRLVVNLSNLVDTLIDKEKRKQLLSKAEALGQPYEFDSWLPYKSKAKIKQLDYAFNLNIAGNLSIKIDADNEKLISASIELMQINEQSLIEDLENGGYKYDDHSGIFYNSKKNVGIKVSLQNGTFSIEIYP